MTITEEWNAIQSLEPQEINFDIQVEDRNQPPFGFSLDRVTEVDSEEDLDSDYLQETDTDWELQASCRSIENSAELFFSEELVDIVAAKRICAECPVIAPCLEGAIARAEPCGVWGGQLFLNGKMQAQKRRRGRPPKVARPEDQLPVVPIPAHLQKLIA